MDYQVDLLSLVECCLALMDTVYLFLLKMQVFIAFYFYSHTITFSNIYSLILPDSFFICPRMSDRSSLSDRFEIVLDRSRLVLILSVPHRFRYSDIV